MRFGIDKIVGVHDDALRLHSKRVQLIATNLANVDTPDYKARDIDFKTMLDGIKRDQDASKMLVTNAKHMTMSPNQMAGAPVKYRVPDQPSLDGNTVDAQRERSEFAQTALHYQASLRFLEGKLQGIISAFRGE